MPGYQTLENRAHSFVDQVKPGTSLEDLTPFLLDAATTAWQEGALAKAGLIDDNGVPTEALLKDLPIDPCDFDTNPTLRDILEKAVAFEAYDVLSHQAWLSDISRKKAHQIAFRQQLERQEPLDRVEVGALTKFDTLAADFPHGLNNFWTILETAFETAAPAEVEQAQQKRFLKQAKARHHTAARVQNVLLFQARGVDYLAAVIMCWALQSLVQQNRSRLYTEFCLDPPVQETFTPTYGELLTPFPVSRKKMICDSIGVGDLVAPQGPHQKHVLSLCGLGSQSISTPVHSYFNLDLDKPKNPFSQAVTVQSLIKASVEAVLTLENLHLS